MEVKRGSRTGCQESPCHRWTRRIGRQTALAFAGAGAGVVTAHRNPGEAADSLSRELKELGGPHRVVRADVTDLADVAALTDACQEALGGLDVVVNNVGVDGDSALRSCRRMSGTGSSSEPDQLLPGDPGRAQAARRRWLSDQHRCVGRPARAGERRALRRFQGGAHRPRPVGWPRNSAAAASGSTPWHPA